MNWRNFFKVKKIEELNDLDLKLDQLDDQHDITFNSSDDILNDLALESPSPNYSKNDENTIKNDQKTFKNKLKSSKNDTKIDKKHHEGHRQRLKEKFMSHELEQIMDYELLEGLLMYAIPRNDVKPLAKSLLRKFNTLKNIFLAPNNQLRLVDGIGDSTLCFFKIINEIVCRFDRLEIMEDISLNSPIKVATYCQSRMGHLKHEQFRVLFLNKKNKLIKDLVLQNGTIDRAAIFPRELILQALQMGAGGLILVHNHPSGDPTPSKADIEITEEIKTAANYMSILLFDHLIIAKGSYYSMKAHRVF